MTGKDYCFYFARFGIDILWKACGPGYELSLSLSDPYEPRWQQC